MPYRRKPGNPIQAPVFRWGLEAGVMHNGTYISRGQKYPEVFESKKYPGYHVQKEQDLDNRGFEDGQWNPYVITIHGQMTRVAEGDRILPEPDGIHFYPCKPDIFLNNYEEIP